MKNFRVRTAHAVLACASLACAAWGGFAATALAADAAAPATPAAAPAPYVMPAGLAGYIVKAVDSADRTPEQKARDVNRKPAELLALSGVKPGNTIVEFAAAGFYFTPMLSDIAGPKGKVLMVDLPYTETRNGEAGRAFAAKHPNSTYTLIDYNKLELPANVDVVFNIMYYHDLPLNSIDTAVLNAKIFKALKPGGVFLVVDHNARPGSGMEDTKKLHRIDPKVIRDEVTAAGFQLAQESKLLARESDDHTQMVFTPGLRGLTDQSIFVFRKPKK